MALSCVDLISIGAGWGHCGGLVDSAPGGTPSEVYIPVGIIVDRNPEMVFVVDRTKEETITPELFYNALGIVLHFVSETVFRFLRFRAHKCLSFVCNERCEVKHDTIVLTCSV